VSKNEWFEYQQDLAELTSIYFGIIAAPAVSAALS
jgi:hypothetical protein